MVLNVRCVCVLFLLIVFTSASPRGLWNKIDKATHRERRDLLAQPQVTKSAHRNRKWVSNFQNIRYMCGTTQVPYDVPTGWIARDGPHGKTNETLYERRYKTIPVCCEGYRRNEEDVCIPACKGECLNGWCLRPNVCDCSEDHVLNSLGHCVPCACENGRCIDGACACNEDYKLDAESLTCKPQCNYTCENADCVAPNTCECRPGYKKSRHIENFCIPHCKNECVNGQCTAPDVCICNSGYYLDNELGVCLPQCDNCVDGLCLHPNVCVCQKGYKKVDDVCLPTCEGRCMNGYCTGNDNCVCHSGYEKFERYTCLPTCTPGCIHGWCKAPNRCECEEGYVETLDASRCELPGGADEADRVLETIRNRVHVSE